MIRRGNCRDRAGFGPEMADQEFITTQANDLALGPTSAVNRRAIAISHLIAGLMPPAGH